MSNNGQKVYVSSLCPTDFELASMPFGGTKSSAPIVGPLTMFQGDAYCRVGYDTAIRRFHKDGAKEYSAPKLQLTVQLHKLHRNPETRQWEGDEKQLAMYHALMALQERLIRQATEKSLDLFGKQLTYDVVKEKCATIIYEGTAQKPVICPSFKMNVDIKAKDADYVPDITGPWEPYYNLPNFKLLKPDQTPHNQPLAEVAIEGAQILPFFKVAYFSRGDNINFVLKSSMAIINPISKTIKTQPLPPPPEIDLDEEAAFAAKQQEMEAAQNTTTDTGTMKVEQGAVTTVWDPIHNREVPVQAVPVAESGAVKRQLEEEPASDAPSGKRAKMEEEPASDAPSDAPSGKRMKTEEPPTEDATMGGMSPSLMNAMTQDSDEDA